MSLAELPAEIIAQIVSEFAGIGPSTRPISDVAALHNLSLVCRSIHAAANSLLWSHIQLHGRDYDTDDNDDWRMSLLNAACQSDPSLVHRIRSATVEWSSDQYADESDADQSDSSDADKGPRDDLKPTPCAPVFNELLFHLGKSENLTSLDVSCHEDGLGVDALPALYSCGGKLTFQQLGRLSIKTDDENQARWIPGEKLLHLTRLPRLRELTIHAPVTVIRPQHVGNDKMPLSNLTKLSFSSWRPLSPTTLKCLLRLLPNLSELQVGVPGPGGTQKQWPLQPAASARFLQPIAASLVKLSLSSGKSVEWKGHDQTSVDFSAFPSLRELNITSDLLFDPQYPSASNVPGVDLAKVLPPRLEKLYIQFDERQGAFWSLHPHEVRGSDPPWQLDQPWDGDLEYWRVEWVAALLKQRRRTGNRSLRAIHIHEDDFFHKFIDWPGSPVLRELALAAGVDFRADLRVPERLSCPGFEQAKMPGVARRRGLGGAFWRGEKRVLARDYRGDDYDEACEDPDEDCFQYTHST